jgi:hypothetical protein
MGSEVSLEVTAKTKMPSFDGSAAENAQLTVKYKYTFKYNAKESE